LPRTVRIGKIHFAAKPLLDHAPVRKFRAPVAGDRFTRYFSYIQRYIVRQLGIFKPHGVQAICSGDQAALSFSFLYSIVACDRNIPR